MIPLLAVALKIAVLNLHATNVPPALAENLSQVLVAEVARQPGAQVIGTSDIAAMLGFEQQKQMLACDQDSACLAELGGALGVDRIVVGQLGQVDSTYLLSLALIDIKQAKVLARVQTEAEGKAAPLIAAIRREVPALFASRAAPLPKGVSASTPPSAFPGSRGARLAAWSGAAACVVAALAGALLHASSNAAYARYEAAVAPADLRAARADTTSLDRASTGAFVVSGAAALVAGGGLMFSF